MIFGGETAKAKSGFHDYFILDANELSVQRSGKSFLPKPDYSPPWTVHSPSHAEKTSENAVLFLAKVKGASWLNHVVCQFPSTQDAPFKVSTVVCPEPSTYSYEGN